jgi:streptogramin lyase
MKMGCKNRLWFWLIVPSIAFLPLLSFGAEKGNWIVFTSPSVISKVLSDGDLLWIGTDGGLIRYEKGNGRARLFTVLDGLPSNHITSICVEGDTVYIGTDKGVGIMDRREGIVGRIGKEEGLAKESVLSLAVGGGSLWIGTAEGGLFRYDWDKKVASLVPFPAEKMRRPVAEREKEEERKAIEEAMRQGLPVAPIGILPISPRALGRPPIMGGGQKGEVPEELKMEGKEEMEGKQWGGIAEMWVMGDKLWMCATGMFAIGRMDLKTGDFEDLTPTAFLTRSPVSMAVGEEDIWLVFGPLGLDVGIEGGMIISPGHVASRFDIKDGTWKHYDMMGYGFEDPRVNAVVMSPGKVWLGGIGQLSCYDRATGTFKHWFSGENGIPDDVVITSLSYDGKYIWCGTGSNGLARWDVDESKWEPVPINIEGEKILPGNNIRSIMRYGSKMWVSFRDEGIAVIDPEDFSYKRITKEDGLEDMVVSMAYGLGKIWLAYANEGVGCYDPETGRIRNYKKVDGLVSKMVRDLCVDKDTVWAGTVLGGAARFVGTRWIPITSIDGLSGDVVLSIAVDGDLVWFGTYGEGVSCLDVKSGTWKIYRSPRKRGDKEAKPEGLGSDIVRDIVVGEGKVWFATSEGLSLFDKASGKWRTFDERDGLVNRDVSCLLLDGERLWVGTRGGLSLYNMADGSWKSFTIVDGLADNSITSLALDPKGNLWVGTIRGLSILRR